MVVGTRLFGLPSAFQLRRVSDLPAQSLCWKSENLPLCENQNVVSAAERILQPPESAVEARKGQGEIAKPKTLQWGCP